MSKEAERAPSGMVGDARRLTDRTRAEVVERQRSGALVAGEAQSIERFLSEFDRLDRPFDMDADPIHVTGSAIVIGAPVGGEPGVLLLRHKRLGIWLQPGGHIDDGESPSEAALREAIEETGLDLELVDGRLVHVDVHPGGRGHLHLDLRYLVRPVQGSDPTPQPPEGESQEIGWFDPTDALARADDDHLKALLADLTRRGLVDVATP